MTVYDFINLCIDDFTLEIYDVDKSEELWRGLSTVCPDEFLDYEVDSFDTPCEKFTLTLNISTEE